VSARALPARPNLDHLKRQAKELLRRQPQIGRLRDAQRVIAQEYGFDSWDALRLHVESCTTLASRGLIKPENLDPGGQAVWDTIAASSSGDVVAFSPGGTV
jgi:hypothetical protein